MKKEEGKEYKGAGKRTQGKEWELHPRAGISCLWHTASMMGIIFFPSTATQLI